MVGVSVVFGIGTAAGSGTAKSQDKKGARARL